MGTRILVTSELTSCLRIIKGSLVDERIQKMRLLSLRMTLKGEFLAFSDVHDNKYSYPDLPR